MNMSPERAAAAFSEQQDSLEQMKHVTRSQDAFEENPALGFNEALHGELVFVSLRCYQTPAVYMILMVK